MRLATPIALGALALGTPAAASAQEDLLERHRPLLRYDSDEHHFARSVPPVPVAERLPPGRPAVYGRAARDGRGRRWLQYWLFFAQNTQDRGIIRTGRHAGDWELLQLRLDAGGRPAEATFAQHSWAEGCGWREIERVGPAPVAYVAAGSHALYPRAGTADRPFPDPNDEADGRGRLVRPPLTVIEERRPAWVSWPGRWGGAEAGPVPGEESSPRGPAFQPERWIDPGAYHERDARSCGADPPGRPWQTALTIGVGVLAAAGGLRLALRSYNRGP